MTNIKLVITAQIIIMFSLLSCDVNLSDNKDFIKNVKITDSGLTCEEVFLSNGIEKISRSKFVYGEHFFVNFNNLSGFKRVNGVAHPGMAITMITSNGDTIMHENDVYKDDSEGFPNQPLVLVSDITLGNPFHSKKDYNLLIHIWDKNGAGTYDLDFKLDVVTNEHIEIETKNLNYSESYLFSKERSMTLPENEVKFGETNYLIFENITGLVEKEGKVQVGMSIGCNNFLGKKVIAEADVFGDELIDVEKVHGQVAASFHFKGEKALNPLTCKVRFWDKRSSAELNATVQLEVR